MSTIKKLALSKKLDWELLKRFNIVVNSTSFGEAAKEIGTSQGALVKQIDNLEESLGEALFVRSAKNRTFELTPAGNLLASLTQKMDNIVYNQIQDKFERDESYEDRKLIRIITTPGISTTLLPIVIDKFLIFNSNIKFELITKRSQPKLSFNEVIIRDDFLYQQDLKVEFLLKIYSHFYASKEYIKNFGSPSSYKELLHHKILSVKYFNISSTDQYTLDQESFIYVDPWIQSDYVNFLIEMALRHQGIIQLPSFHPSTNQLIKITQLEGSATDIYVGYLNAEKQDDILYKFVNYLKTEINSMKL